MSYDFARARRRTRPIKVFAAEPASDLLLAAPAGARATMGLDPGFRSGVKVAVAGSPRARSSTPPTIYPLSSRSGNWDDSGLATRRCRRSCAKHKVELDRHRQWHGQSRETDKSQSQTCWPSCHADLKPVTRAMVSEAGASVYSASAFASAEELPGHGRVAARRRVDRAPSAGPIGRTRKNRPEIDRRRPVPA